MVPDCLSTLLIVYLLLFLVPGYPQIHNIVFRVADEAY